MLCVRGSGVEVVVKVVLLCLVGVAVVVQQVQGEYNNQGATEIERTKHYVTFSSVSQQQSYLPIKAGATVKSVLKAPEEVLYPLKGGESIETISVTLKNLVHPNPERLSALLVGPTGVHSTLFFSCAVTCGSGPVTLTFDEAVPNAVQDIKYLCSLNPKSTEFSVRSGICKNTEKAIFPAPYQPGDGFISLVAFEGKPMAGEWTLMIHDNGEEATNQFNIEHELETGRIDSWGIEALLIEAKESPTPIAVDVPLLTIEERLMNSENAEELEARAQLSDELAILHQSRLTNASNGTPEMGDTNVAYFDNTAATVTFYALDDGQVDSSTGYAVVLNSISETDANGNIISGHTWTFPTTGYTITNPSSGEYVYSIVFQGATFTFTFSYYNIPTRITFGTESFVTYGDSTLLNVKIDSWPFDPSAEGLQFEFGLNAVSGTFDPATVAAVPDTSLVEISYRASDGSFTAKYTVVQGAIVDGSFSSQVSIQASGNNAIVKLPKFTTSLEWDPDFGMVVAPKDSGDDSSGGDDTAWIIAVSVVVPFFIFVVVAAIVIGTVVAVIARRRFRRGISNRQSTSFAKDEEEFPSVDN